MKIATGYLKGRTLESPKNADMRPTTEMCRQALFNICQNACEGAEFLDLFAGSGAIGIEALSRGAASTTFVEANSNCVKCIKSNLTKLDLTKVSHVYSCDVFEAMKRLAKQKKSFDIIYADPPYHDKHDKGPSLSLKVLEAIEMHTSLLKPGGLLFVEDAIEVDTKTLPHLTLISVRHLGRSVLHEFSLTPSM